MVFSNLTYLLKCSNCRFFSPNNHMSSLTLILSRFSPICFRIRHIHYLLLPIYLLYQIFRLLHVSTFLCQQYPCNWSFNLIPIASRQDLNPSFNDHKVNNSLGFIFLKCPSGSSPSSMNFYKASLLVAFCLKYQTITNFWSRPISRWTWAVKDFLRRPIWKSTRF